MNSNLIAVRHFITGRHSGRLITGIGKRLWSTALLFAAVTIALQLLFTLYPWTIFPLLWDAAAASALVWSICLILDPLVLHPPALLSTARLIEKNHAEQLPHPLLAIALELSVSGTHTELHDEVYRRAAGQIGTCTHRSKGRFEPWRLPVTVILLMTTAGMFFTLRPLLSSYWRLPATLFGKTAATVAPGTVSVPRGASVTLRLVPEKLNAPSCQLAVTTAGGEPFAARWLREDSTGAFSLRLDTLTASIVYRFNYGTTAYRPETVTVVPPPYLQRLQVELRPPAYTGLPVRRLPEGLGDFTAHAGSRALITIESSPLRAASIRCGDTTFPLQVAGNRASCELTVKNNAFYTFSLIDTFLQKSDSLTNFTIGLLPDESPEVRFLRPGTNKAIEPSQCESLLVEATDDLGIRSCALCWYKNGDRPGEASQQDLSPQKPQRLWQKEFVWKISRLSLYPGDTLYYWAQARDTRFGTPGRAVSDTFWFRLPTLDEIHRSMARRDDDARATISGVRKSQDELMQAVKQLDKATAAGSQENAWDQQQLAKKIEKSMQAQADSLEQSLKRLDENVKSLRNQGEIGEDIARKMDEIRNAIRELAAMYGDSLLFPKNESGELSLDEMRQAVDKLNELLPELSKRLDNTLQFLEALKRDRALAELAMRAEQLAAEQAQLSESATGDKTTSSRQKDLLDRIDRLQKDIREKSGNEGESADSESMQQIDSLGNSMNEQLAGQKCPNGGTMRQMSAGLSSLAQQLREKMSSFMMEQMEAMRNKLLDMAGSTLDLSAWQEQTRSGDNSTEEARRAQAQAQQAISEALGLLEKQTDSLPMLPPSVHQQLRSAASSAREASKAAVQSLGESDGRFGMRISNQAIGQFTAKLLETVSAMSQQQNGNCNGGASGMRESLRRMSGRQAAINAATAQLLRAMMQGKQPGSNGEGGDGSSNERARKEAQAAQQALANDLKALGEKFGDASGEAMKDRVKQLEEEARTLMQMLDQPREEVTERQDRFLARMLQSALSLHREEEGKEERKSTTAGIVFTKSDGAAADSLLRGNDTFHMVRRRALFGGSYPPDYRQSINAYFDSLGVLFLK